MRTMPHSHRALVATLSLLAAGGIAGALSPDEVLVVANGRLEESVSLAKTYADRRGIAGADVIVLRTHKGTAISRERFRETLALPLKKALAADGRAGRIRCLCLVWGVPVRVSAPENDPWAAAASAINAALKKLHYRLAADREMLDTVARQFPAPRTKDLHPVAALFPTPMPAPPKPLPKIDRLAADLQRMLKAKAAAVRRLADPARRRLAERQMAAMHFELLGLEGLLAHVTANDPPGAPKAADIRKQIGEVKSRLGSLRRKARDPGTPAAMLPLIERLNGVLVAATFANRLTGQLGDAGHLTKGVASVDSELATLLWPDAKPAGAAANPLHWKAKDAAAARRTLLTARIDGPTRADAMRIVKASLATEAEGLDGVFYIDAGGPQRVGPTAREHFDRRLGELARFAAAHTSMKVVHDTRPTVFQRDACPHAALYVGWYSLRKYIPAFMWKPGAVGFHVASWEAVHLRDPETTEWCAKMIQNGVAATIGAVDEPLLHHFPNPAEFFPLLMTGKYTVAECYWRTIPAASWQFTLIADPLYNPFKANPQVKLSDLPPGLAP